VQHREFETSSSAARYDHVFIGYDYCELETALLGLAGERDGDTATANPEPPGELWVHSL